MSFQMIQDFRLARELLCMTNAGTDLAVQIPDVSLDLKILLAIQNRWKDKINMRYFGQPSLMLPPKRGATVSLYIVCILTWSHWDFQKNWFKWTVKITANFTANGLKLQCKVIEMLKCSKIIGHVARNRVDVLSRLLCFLTIIFAKYFLCGV